MTYRNEVVTNIETVASSVRIMHSGKVVNTKENLSGLAILARNVVSVLVSTRDLAVPPPLGPVPPQTVSVLVGRLNTTTGKKLVRQTLAMHMLNGRKLLAVTIVLSVGLVSF